MEAMNELVFLKLGGSLITDKTLPYTVRRDKLTNLAAQISAALHSQPDLSLILGHGSGSFGHTAAKEHDTRQGVKTAAQWHGFAEVWFQASALNRFVMQALHEAGVPCLALAPVSAVSAYDGKVSTWDLSPLKSALAAGLVPVIYGDVIFDQVRGGTILSTEDLFEVLARELKPRRILLAGLEASVWADFPKRQQRVEIITPASFALIKAGVGASQGTDVTGGMDSKVQQMLALVKEIPELTAQIFSGEQPANIQQALAGKHLGTIIAARQT
jgi:isopentenyl phosphate kinase